MNTVNATTNLVGRRSFLGAAGAAAVGIALPTIVPSSALGLDGAVAPSERIHVGIIGIGPRCRYVLKPILGFEDVRCIAIADVQAKRRDEGKEMIDLAYGNQECKVSRDFRELLDRKDIDAVIIATGDRWHASASILAAKAGKDIYCEKPCGLTIEYCQQISETIRATGRVFQAGTQRRSVINFQQAVELAHMGKLGNLQKLFAPVYVPSIETAWLPGQPTPEADVVDWNAWLGPAPWRPYNDQYVSGGWRGQWDFDSGARLLDWGAHTLDLCQWANRADDTMPIEYQPTAQGIECRYSNGVSVLLEFLATPFGEKPGWIKSIGTCPVRFVGDAGWVETGDSGELHWFDDGKKRDVQKNQKLANGLDVDAHARNFFDCIRSRKPTNANAEVMRRSHVACHAAALAWILQRTLRLDPATESFIDDPEANRLKSRPARDPWA